MSDRKRMELDELRLTPEFLKLTEKQRLFVETYCAPTESGERNYDAVQATRTAYKCKTPEIARILSYALLQNIRIVTVLNRHFNRTPTEEFLINLDRAIHNKHLTIAQVQALKMQCDFLGQENRLPLLGAPTDKIPKEVQQAAKAERKAKKLAAAPAPVKPAEPVKRFF
jgi:hypothetical protein